MPIVHTTEIRYGSSTDFFAFSGLPTPFLSRSEENVYHNGKWCELTTLTLDGQIIGKNYTADGDGFLNAREITEDRNAILEGFAQDFQTLSVIEDATTVISFEGNVVKSISFDAANYGAQDYSIELSCYEQSTFKDSFGVTEPVNTVTFTEENNGLISIEHEVSAIGFPTTGSYSNKTAIENAIDFVTSRTGYSTTAVIPEFMTNLGDVSLVLTNVSKAIDRGAGTYSFAESYKIQTGLVSTVSGTFVAGVVNTIDASVTSGIGNDFTRVAIKYTVQGGKDMADAALRANIPSTGTLYRVATGAYGNTAGLYYIPQSYSLEDRASTNKTISISAEFDDDARGWNEYGTFFDYSVSVNTDDVTDRASVSIDGNFIARGTFNNRFSGISGYYFNNIVSGASGQTTTGYLYNLANEIYTGLNYNVLYGANPASSMSNPAVEGGASGWGLNPNYESLSVDIDELKGNIGLKATFNNHDYLHHFKEGDWSITVTPSLRQYAAKASCNENGLYGLYDLNTYTRAKLTWDCNFTPMVDGKYFPHLFIDKYGYPFFSPRPVPPGNVPPPDWKYAVPYLNTRQLPSKASQEVRAYSNLFSGKIFASGQSGIGGVSGRFIVADQETTTSSPTALNQFNFSQGVTYEGLEWQLF